MIAEIPLRAAANQEMLIVLQRQDCYIRIVQRHAKMYLTLTISDIEIWSGFICRDRLPMAQSRTYWDKFDGNLVFVDLEGTEDPYYDRLGSRWKLYYFTNDESMPEWFQTVIIDLKGV